MRQFGGTLILFGVGSIILNLINMEFILLMWVDMWGPTVGWIIRIAMIVLGGVLFALGEDEE